MEYCVQVFAKAPQQGQVKTRLMPVLGAIGAREIYTQLLWRTLTLASRYASVQLWCSPHTEFTFFAHCQQHFGVSLHQQQGADLGVRMQYALETALQADILPLLVGADCWTLQTEDLQHAHQHLLQGKAAVFAPSTDGGYVLIGLSQPVPQVFSHMTWSHAQVMAETRRRLQLVGLDWAELAYQRDLDTSLDWLEYLANARCRKPLY